MKESKKIYNLNEDVDKETEKRFNEELNEIKEKLNSEKLSDEFKANLKAKLQEELDKSEDSNKGKIVKFPTFTRKLAGICACFVFLFSSCFVFADDIENVILELFGNTDRIIANAIEEGNYREVQMDYVEYNGISIKVDYVVVEDDNLYIAFNVLSEEEFDRIIIDGIEIQNQNNEKIYTKLYNTLENSMLTTIEKKVNANNQIIIYKLNNERYDINKIDISVYRIDFIKDNIGNIKNGKWNFNVNI